ncbi:MAG: thiamine-phosphate kinase [Nitrospirae bacterium]|nr:thiamine-phosphate kinase [Nitrospirota bacterium]
MHIEKLGEFGFIRRIEKRFQTKVNAVNDSIILGIGDDAAAINPARGKCLLFSTDTLREDIHFKREYASFYDIGWKSVAVSISDIAAMAGIPRYLLLSLAIPEKTSVKNLDDLLNGVKAITERYNVSLIGGNIARVYGGITVDTTVIGEVTKKRIIKRAGASPGDLIYVTGRIGCSAMGLALLQSSLLPLKKNPPLCSRGGMGGVFPDEAPLINTHLHPIPRVTEALIIGANRLATSMIDISDGLVSDLSHICEQSNVGACIYSNLIPLPELPHTVTEKIKKRLAKSPLFYALYGGEDYELLFTVKQNNKQRLEKIFKREGIEITYIGEVVQKEAGISIIDEKGRKKKISMTRNSMNYGYDHFKTQRGKKC